MRPLTVVAYGHTYSITYLKSSTAAQLKAYVQVKTLLQENKPLEAYQVAKNANLRIIRKTDHTHRA